MRLPCIILAGGLATRMRPLTHSLPKTLLRVRGVPFADLQLQWLRSQGVTRVVYSTGHLGHLIRAHVGDGAQYGLRVDYADDGPALRGTAGAVRRVIDSGLVDEDFFVLNGDSLLDLDLSRMESAFRAASALAMMTVLRNKNRWVPSNAVVAGDRVVLYDKRPEAHVPDMEWIDYGISAMHSGAVTDAVPPGEAADLADVMHALSVGGRLASFEVSKRFFEIGTTAGLRDLEDHLAGSQRPGRADA